MQTNCRLLPSMLIILQTVIDAILSIAIPLATSYTRRQ